MIELEGTYTFPRQWLGIEFVNPTMTIEPVVDRVDPINNTINVYIVFEVNGDVKGRFHPDINPVPVMDLSYDSGTLVARILERLNDFKVV